MTKQKPVYLLAGGRGSANQAIFRMIMAEIAAEKGGSKAAKKLEIRSTKSETNTNDQKREMLETKSKEPVIAYVGVASDEDKGFFRFMEGEMVKGAPCEVRQVLIARPKADLDKAREMLHGADAVFMSGGDVEAGIKTLKAKGMFDIFGELRRQGKLFFGASAGSIMLGSEWVKWHDAEDDSTAELFECLGIAPVICDTHAEEDDWVELKAALALKEDGAVGYGIPSGGCLKVHPDGRLEAIGKAVVRYVKKGRKVVDLEQLTT
jgi:cyanophycinase-like exopeptidase